MLNIRLSEIVWLQTLQFLTHLVYLPEEKDNWKLLTKYMLKLLWLLKNILKSAFLRVELSEITLFHIDLIKLLILGK